MNPRTRKALRGAPVAALALILGCVAPTRGQVVDVYAVPVAPRVARSESDQLPKATSSESEPADVTERRFCRSARPLLAELRGLVSRHVRCISSRYVEAGYLGDTSDLASHSVSRACFLAQPEAEQALRFEERPLSRIHTTISARLRIGADGGLDLSRFGIEPSRYVLQQPDGVSSATIRISFVDPVVREIANLGPALAAVELQHSFSEEVRRAAAQCRQQMCEPTAVRTMQIVSANLRIDVTLEDGQAQGLRAGRVTDAVLIDGQGRSFAIRPMGRVNLAATFALSAPELARSNACGVEPEMVDSTRPGVHSACSTIEDGGVRATLVGCTGNKKVRCSFILSSTGRDRDVVLRGREHSSLFDDRGAAHFPHSMSVGDEWFDSRVSFTLLADVSTVIELEFGDVPADLTLSPRVSLAVESDREVAFSFRQVEIGRGEIRRCDEGSR